MRTVFPPSLYLSLSESVLHAIAGARVLPRQRIFPAGDKTSATLQATVTVYDDLASFIQCIEIGRANVQAVADGAAGLTDFLANADMSLLTVNLKDVQP
jgi:hypothetical protein